jgi:hypothetical protein
MSKNYFSYLMRLWHSSETAHGEWFASLEDPMTKQVLHFKSIEALYHYLLDQLYSNGNNNPINQSDLM